MNFEKSTQSIAESEEDISRKEITTNGQLTKESEEFIEPENFINKVINKGRVLGEGGKGVVLEVAFNQTENASKQDNEGNFSEDSKAVKLLKVYAEGVGRKEYELQNRIAELVNQSNKSPCALVPRGYHYEDASLSQDQKKGLEQRTGHKFHKDSAELFMMDYIDADELYERLMKEVVWRAHSDISKEKVAKLSKQEIEKRAERAVGFREKAANSEGLNQKGQDEFRSFVTKMYDFLKKKGVKIKGEIIEQIGNTTTIFSDNNLQHNDLHERNIMIDGPLFSDSPGDNKDGTQVYIIDFGEMVEKDKGNSAGMKDDVVLNRLRKNFTAERPPVEQLKEELIQINQDYTNLSAYENIYAEQKAVLEGDKTDKVRRLMRNFQKHGSADKRQMKIFFAALYDKVRSNQDDMNTAIAFIRELNQHLTSHWQKELVSNVEALFQKT